MTNPGNAVGTNAAYDGRTSANAFNDDLAGYTSGILTGWACSPNTGLTVSLGGDGSTRDVAIAEDNAGNKTTINNISGSPVNVTLDSAPGSNSRIDLVVAYVDNPPTGTSTVADNPSACGIIKVTGTASASPTPPNDSAIRTAITADGASGVTAYYAILAQITVATGTTDLTSDDISAGAYAGLNGNNINFSSFSRNSDGATGYYTLGNLQICWGYYELTIGTSAYSEASHAFTFAKPFASVPTIVVSNGDVGGYCGEYSLISSRSTTGCTVTGGHVASSSSNKMVVSYLAIGVLS